MASFLGVVLGRRSSWSSVRPGYYRFGVYFALSPAGTKPKPKRAFHQSRRSLETKTKFSSVFLHR